MVYLPNNLNILLQRLTKAREDFDKAKKRIEHFINVHKSELYDKFVAEPIDLAKAANKSKEEIADIKQKGLVEYNIQLEKDKKKKMSELKLPELKKEIINIKQRILELDPQINLSNLGKDINKKDSTPNAQNRFEVSY